MVENAFVLMPAYNAGATIEKVFARIPPEAKQRIRRYVVANDGSTDDTEAALARLRAQIPSLVTLTHAVNRGYGAAEKLTRSSLMTKCSTRRTSCPPPASSATTSTAMFRTGFRRAVCEPFSRRHPRGRRASCRGAGR